MKTLLILGLLWGQLAFAAKDTGGGDHVPPWVGTAWFRFGSGPINTCYVLNPGFGVENRDVESSISQAFSIWSTYLDQKLMPYDDARLIEKRFRFVRCDGNEDLKFYFGVEDEKTQEAKRKFVDPISFAHRQTQNLVKRDQGFIWLAGPKKIEQALKADWRTSHLLTGVLLHELGHVFGNPHVPGTIMREEIVDFLVQAIQKSAETRAKMLSQIDWEEALILRAQGRYPGSLVLGAGEVRRRQFLKLMGRPPKGPISAEVIFKSYPLLKISDDSGVETFDVNLIQPTHNISRNVALFQTYDPVSREKRFVETPASVSLGWIQGKSGIRINCFVSQGGRIQIESQTRGNAMAQTLYSPLVIRTFEENMVGKLEDLFVAWPGGIPFDAK